MNNIILIIVYILLFQAATAQFKWLKTNYNRVGVVYGYASQNTVIKQDSDYDYEYNVVKITNHFKLISKDNTRLELLIEPAYYKSKHKLHNYWYKTVLVPNGDELRAIYFKLKDMNEYVLNVGVVYRRYFWDKTSVFASLNTGPMYIDTETERLKKGIAFSDVLGLGFSHKINSFSFDVKGTFRHVSNANLQRPNAGYNSVGFELGTYYEFR